jgi:hypothetical protein
VDALALLGGEGGEDLVALGLTELVEGQLVVIAHEVAPLVAAGDGGPRLDRLAQGRGILSREGQVQTLVGDEVELHRQLVAVGVAEETHLLVVRQVDLAEHHRVAAAARDVSAQLPQELVLGSIVAVDDERHGIHPETVDAELEPEADGLRDLFAHLGVVGGEVGLVPIERVLVVLTRCLVEEPDSVFDVGEHAFGRVFGNIVAPLVEVAVAAVGARAGLLEPRMPVGGVVHHEVDDHAHAAVVRGAQHLHHVAQRAVAGIDAVVVLDVVAVVTLGRGVERGEPQARHAELGEVVEPLRETAQVAHAVAVGVQVRLDVEVVEDRGLPPQIARIGEPHAVTPVWASVRRGAYGKVVIGALFSGAVAAGPLRSIRRT